jgi:hypothetical protein
VAWRALPLPATTVQRIGTDVAIVGFCGSRRFLYELRGAPPIWPRVWDQFYREDTELYVNTQVESADHQWLDANFAIQWRPQAPTYWRMLSAHAQTTHYQDWYIPYFDRI